MQPDVLVFAGSEMRWMQIKDIDRRTFLETAVFPMAALGVQRTPQSFGRDWQSRGVGFVTLGEGIDTSTPAGRLLAGVLASIAEFERARIQERIIAGLHRARAHGKRIRRPRATRLPTNAAPDLTVRQAAAAWDVSKSTAAPRLREGVAPFTTTGTL